VEGKYEESVPKRDMSYNQGEKEFEKTYLRKELKKEDTNRTSEERIWSFLPNP
jgi:hypothetical protein